MLLAFYIVSWVFFLLLVLVGFSGTKINTKGFIVLVVSFFGVVLSLVHLIGGSI